MKTAVEWHKELIGNSATYVSVAAIEAIQTDARRQGMLDAAEKCLGVGFKHQQTDTTYSAGKKAGAMECHKAIQSAADNLQAERKL